MIEHTVVWDGRRSGPGGSQLFADEYARQQAAASPSLLAVNRDLRTTLTDLLTQRPMSMRELSQASGATTYKVNQALYYLQRNGVVVVLTKRPARRVWGREESVYTLANGGAR